MASRTSSSKGLFAYFATAAVSIAVTAFSFGLAQCSAMQTKEDANQFETQARQEHRDFRETMVDTRTLIYEKIAEVLERLPPKR